MTTRTTRTTAKSNRELYNKLLKFRLCSSRELYINGQRCTCLFREEVDNDKPIKNLILQWHPSEYENPVANDRFFLNVLLELPDLEELELRYFPFESFTPTTATQETGIETNQPNHDNNNNNNNNDNNATDNLTTTSMTIWNFSLKLKITNYRHNRSHLPPAIGMLVNLTELHLIDRNHDRLESLPLEIFGLQRLQSLHLYGLTALQSLPSEIGNLLNLKELVIWNCRSLVDLPKEIGKLQCLQELHICDNHSLQQLPLELNDLCGNLQTLIISHNERLKPTGFLFQINHFTKLRKLEINWEDYTKGDDIATALLQSLPNELEKLCLRDCNAKDFGSIPPTHLVVPTTSATTTSTVKLSSLLDLLPSNINNLSIEGSAGRFGYREENQHVIQTFLQTFPRLSICSNRFKIRDMDIQCETTLGWFNKESLQLMFFNRCGRALTKHVSSSVVRPNKTQQRPLPLSMWLVVFEDVRKRIGRMWNKKSEQIMEASVIFALLQEAPALLDRTISESAANCSLDDTTNIVAETETAPIPSEPIANLKHPYPYHEDHEKRN